MKTLKITLLLALFLAAFTSCTKEDLNEDELLINPEIETLSLTGGSIDEGRGRN